MRLSGGGGHGNPFARDPAAVLNDVIEQKVSLAHARDAYGVVIGGSPLQIDRLATQKLRAQNAGSGESP